MCLSLEFQSYSHIKCGKIARHPISTLSHPFTPCIYRFATSSTSPHFIKQSTHHHSAIIAHNAIGFSANVFNHVTNILYNMHFKSKSPWKNGKISQLIWVWSKSIWNGTWASDRVWSVRARNPVQMHTNSPKKNITRCLNTNTLHVRRICGNQAKSTWSRERAVCFALFFVHQLFILRKARIDTTKQAATAKNNASELFV